MAKNAYATLTLAPELLPLARVPVYAADLHSCFVLYTHFPPVIYHKREGPLCREPQLHHTGQAPHRYSPRIPALVLYVDVPDPTSLQKSSAIVVATVLLL